jgi:FKBP-type peptidyl-prolyl cis-trans isomerase FklB
MKRPMVMRLVFAGLLALFSVQALVSGDVSDEGLRFRQEHAGKEGVIVLPSGLQYRILSEGDGRKPSPTDSVEVYYRGTLINGREFDAADIIRPPVVFRIDGLIPGWIEALQLMTEGSVWEIVLPPHLGYGERGSGAKIPPNATLVFEMELVRIR